MKWLKRFGLGLLALFVLTLISSLTQSYLAETQVQVRTASIDLDAREDEPGIQYEASTLKNIPLRLVVLSRNLALPLALALN
mgnify:CR=1 FL=1